MVLTWVPSADGWLRPEGYFSLGFRGRNANIGVSLLLRTFGNIWRHFLSSEQRGSYWHLVASLTLLYQTHKLGGLK